MKVDDFIRLVHQQEGDKYVLGSKVNKNDPDPDVFDCSGLVEWALGRLGISLPRPAQSQYYALQKQGKAITADAALKLRGALVFKKGATSATRPRPIYHVGVTIGNGEVIEAKGRKYGVVHSKNQFGKWQLGAIIPGITAGQSSPSSGGVSMASLALLAALALAYFYYGR